jgi:hypothetical protein
LGAGDRSVSIRQCGRGDLFSNALPISWINFAAFCQYSFNPISAKEFGLALPLRLTSYACAAGVFGLPNDATNARAYDRIQPTVAIAPIGKSQNKRMRNNP